MSKILHWLKSLFNHKKPAQKRVLEKINIIKPFKKKNACRTKKIAKRK